MEKIETKTKQIEGRTHYFYCDDCGVELGHSYEYNDGWYPTLGDFELEWLTPKGWYRFHKCLCNTCKDKRLDDVYASLEAAGFEIDED